MTPETASTSPPAPLLSTYQSYNYLDLNEVLDDYVNLYFDIGEFMPQRWIRGIEKRKGYY
ncbi:MAG: hypothetical protein IPH94_15920 [Saprospiraceae bacterium]|nr:hypothetical protein [Saprospiraceae bacterium]